MFIFYFLLLCNIIVVYIKIKIKLLYLCGARILHVFRQVLTIMIYLISENPY